MLRKTFVMGALALGLGVVLGTGLGCGKKGGSSGKPKVAVSIFPIYDLTRRIAGDKLDVMLVLPPGKSEHGYDPTPKEIARLEGAKLGFAVGLDMDGWVENIMRSASGDAKVIRLGDKVQTIPIDVEPIGEGEEHEHEEHGHDDDDHDKAGSAVKKPDDHDDHDHDAKKPADKKGDTHDDHDDHDDHAKKPDTGSATAKADRVEPPGPKKGEAHEDHGHGKVGAPDPHFWLDPERMAGVVDMIAAELSVLDPANKATYEANATKVKTAIADTDATIASRSKAWTRRTIVTFHGSMAYFAKRYKIQIAAVVEPIAGREPTAAYIAEVIGAIKRSKAAALFTEPQLDKAPGMVIATEAGIPLGELDPVGGVPGRDSYESLLVWNTDQLEKALK